MRKLLIVLVVVGLTCVIAFSVKRSVIHTIGTAPVIPIVNPVKEIDGYRAWTKVNAVPQLMPERVSSLCGIWVSPAGVVVDGPKNPHRKKYFTVFVNAVGRNAMLSKKPQTFPVGSVIVKEKLAAVDGKTPELLTVMIKHQAGFNSAAGDWEYLVIDGAGTKLEGRGNLANCESCHLARQATDYVFRTYLPEDAAKKPN